MPAGNIAFQRHIGTVQSDGTARLVELPGMASLLNVGPEIIYISESNVIAADQAQHDGEMFLPVNVPVPLPRAMRKFYHKTAAATAVLLVVTDVS
jgi:hypothetical protein